MESRDVLRELASRASRYAINLDDQIERGPWPCYLGGYSQVFRGALRSDGSSVAIKMPLCGVGMGDKSTIKRILNEAHTRSKLKHPNVLRILGITTDFDFTVSIITPWMEGGNAHTYVQDPDIDPRPLIKDVALGIRYLHSHPEGPIIHGDLKGDNVLIASDGHAVLTGFGLSVLENSTFSMTLNCQFGGSLRWMAPEMVNALSSGDPQFTLEGDIWAFGMTMLELFTRKFPYCNLNYPSSVIYRITMGSPERPSSEDTCHRMTDNWWDLCSHCLRMEPSLRARVPYVVEWIKQLKFPLRPCDVPIEAESDATWPTQHDVTQFNQSNYSAPSDVPRQLVERAYKYVSNLDDQIERGPSPYYRGARTLIYRGKLLSDGRTVAIKTPQGVGMDDEGIIKQILKEAYIGSKLKHPNILSILGITTRFDFTVSIITPWMEGGNAHTYVQDPDIDPRPLIKDIALGLRYLHTHPKGPIIHRDLRGQNVLIASDGRAVLTDFGLSVLENSSFSMTVNRQFGGSLRWMAPEMVNTLGSQDPGFTLEGDIWAFGMTALELFTRKFPYCSLTNLSSIQFRILKGPPERPSREDTCYRMTDEWWNLCLRCFRVDPSSRISIENVVEATRELPPSACVVLIMRSKLNRNHGLVQPGYDIVIVVMGPTGSGKSNFVNKLTGCEGEHGADEPISLTRGIREFVLDVSRNKRYVFVDMPGFNNAFKSDQDILGRVAEWLRNKYLQHVKITGVIYTHRTTDNRMPTSVRENLAKFCELCGENAVQYVRLVTTRWDKASDAGKVPSWVSLFEGDWWKPPTAAGARHEQFLNTQNSALTIVNGLVGQDAQLSPEEVRGADMQMKEISVTGTRISSIPQWFSSWFSARSSIV
ncbi:kinase-like domain-containing protein [Pisolithus orientalis]|uniref:kinase-like domain-containing protein n=1 Tax=Pisolithus orientalis TaxID=936130 RepID=UPI0022242808|nr:kinase-like domain-containing protein [Pisolithus orientalis]KAI6006285.1 kinase-like domain-containing protein [Pisolithus orientalis]